VSTCAACTQVPVPIGFACTQLTAKGATLTWDGTTYPRSSCVSADGSKLACATPTCAQPGAYVATMCAASGTSCGGSGTGGTVCTKVLFEYPMASATLTGTVP
jgi:hypothetical protein